MLIEFSVTNFLSFKNKATLSMVAAERDKTLPQNLVPPGDAQGLSLLKTAAVYGANASGKSNLWKAFNVFQSLVIKSAFLDPSVLQEAIPFRLHEESENAPTEFEIVFLLDGVRYCYGVALDRKKIHREWLFSYPKKQTRLLFDRDMSRDAKERFKFGPHWKGHRRQMADMTRDNALFLSVSAQMNHPVCLEIANFFDSSTSMISHEDLTGLSRKFNEFFIFSEKTEKEKIINLLNLADFSINDIIIKDKEGRITHENDYKNVWTQYELMELISLSNFEIIFRHKKLLMDGTEDVTDFKLNEESTGTIHFLYLLPILMMVFRNGCILFIDEFELHLHPLLTQWIIKLFNDPEMNPKGCQLVFMTHDAGLLESGLLRRDQIWFTEKNQRGESELFSLWDFIKTPRKVENIRKNYLAGRYGAVPILSDIFPSREDQ
jgi:AAA15 family ATPase/GTPase